MKQIREYEAQEIHPDLEYLRRILIEMTNSYEEVVAYVAFKEGQSLEPEEILDHCREHLAPFKVPREVVIEPELPKSPIGKILRREVRRMAMERFGQVR